MVSIKKFKSERIIKLNEGILTTTYSIIPTSQNVKDPSSGTLTVTFVVTRSGDISQADTENWSIIEDPTITPGTEQNFFPSGEPSGQIKFSAGASQAQAPITVVLKGGIDVLPSGNDWGTFDLGVKLGVATQSTSGFSESASGGYGVTVNNYIINGYGGTLSLNYNMYTIPDQADVYLNGQKILTTGGPVSDTGALTYPGAGQVALKPGDDVEVVITGNIQGTAWDYSVNYSPGISSVVEGHTTVDTGVPSIAELARLSSDSYNGSPGQNLNGYTPLLVSGNSSGSVNGAGIDLGYVGFQAYAYQNANGSQIVVAFRGTNPQADKSLAKNILSDSSWISGTPSADFEREVKDAVAFVDAVDKIAASTGAKVTLTGHSLGGAVAQAIGSAGLYNAVGFDAPGARNFLSKLASDGDFGGLTAGTGGALSNYRLYGDQVSLVGNPIGSQYTVANPNGLVSSILRPDIDHSITILRDQLVAGAPISAGATGPNYLGTLQNAVQGTSTGIGLQLITMGVAAGVSKLIDPSIGHNFVFIENAASPDISTITLPYEVNVSQYRLETLVGGQWVLDSSTAIPGNTFSFSPGVRGVEFVPLDSSGDAQLIPASFFQASFAASGQVSASFLSENGDETSYDDFNGDTTSDVLWINGTQADEWKISGGKWAGSVAIGNHPGAGQAAGIGDFNGDGTKDVLWYDQSSGQTDIWELSNGKWAASVSPGNHPTGYRVAGIGDFNGDGTSDILWYDSGTHDVDEWRIVNGHWAGSVDLGSHPGNAQIASIGDFNGDGTSDVLWYDQSSGQTDIWELSNGKWAASVSPGSHPLGYQLAGVGDFSGYGTSDILFYNPTSGDVDEWKIANGKWAGSIDIGSHPAGWQISGTGDYNGDGTSDVLWSNPTTGQTDVWLLANGKWAASLSAGTHPTGWSVVA
jgi:hypothetical protein